MEVYLHTQCRCISTHNAGVSPHTMEVHLHTQWRCISTHNGGASPHTMQVYLHTQCRCISTHNAGVSPHTMEVYLHTQWRCISTNNGGVSPHTHSPPPFLKHRKSVLCPGRFMPARRAPFIRQSSTALENTDVVSLLGNEPRLLRCPRKTPTQRTRCAVQHCCRQRTVPAQDSPGQGHILGPARWTGGISLSPKYTFHSFSSLYSSVIRQELLFGDTASVH